MSKFNKVYASMDEFFLRYANFLETSNRVETQRQAHLQATGQSGEEVYGLTKFADLSQHEFRRLLGFKPSSTPRQAVVPPNRLGSLPTKLDWRDKKAVTEVKDQQQCGSCWAFSAAEEVESMAFMNGFGLNTFSEQQIVSCDSVDGGCNGGDTISAYQYIEQAGGLETENAYPYTSGGGDTGTCQLPTNPQFVINVLNYSYATPPCSDDCNSQNETKLQESLVTQGPISICVNAEPWQTYTGGVLSSGCAHSSSDLDHCVQLVGYDTSSKPHYWIVRNSWNTNWGIDGYIKIAMGSNLCGIADEATFVRTIKV